MGTALFDRGVTDVFPGFAVGPVVVQAVGEGLNAGRVALEDLFPQPEGRGSQMVVYCTCLSCRIPLAMAVSDGVGVQIPKGVFTPGKQAGRRFGAVCGVSSDISIGGGGEVEEGCRR